MAAADDPGQTARLPMNALKKMFLLRKISENTKLR
jgi:hypothetical protein